MTVWGWIQILALVGVLTPADAACGRLYARVYQNLRGMTSRLNLAPPARLPPLISRWMAERPGSSRT